jgi:hypothetical protein
VITLRTLVPFHLEYWLPLSLSAAAAAERLASMIVMKLQPKEKISYAEHSNPELC